MGQRNEALQCDEIMKGELNYDFNSLKVLACFFNFQPDRSKSLVIFNFKAKKT